jgi:hypothetical protein
MMPMGIFSTCGTFEAGVPCVSFIYAICMYMHINIIDRQAAQPYARFIST